MTDTTTPMARQYALMKEKAGDAVLFFRLGDFYEMFDSDAVEVSALLNLTLTKRQERPMCGIPHHAARSYIARLLRAGRKVAICEQVGEIGKGLVERDIVEIVTPGTVVDEEWLEKNDNNYLLAICAVARHVSIAWMDASTGEFNAYDSADEDVASTIRREIARLAPKEMILQRSLLEVGDFDQEIASQHGVIVNAFPDWCFDIELSSRLLRERFGTATLKGFGFEDDAPALAAAGALLTYVEENLRRPARHVTSLTRRARRSGLVMDEATMRNLELFRNLRDGGRDHTLIGLLDETRTAMGARLLRRWIATPLGNRVDMTERLDCVETLYRDQAGLSRDRSCLSGAYDLERLAAKAATRRTNAKDALAVAATIERMETLVSQRGSLPGIAVPESGDLESLRKLRELLRSAVDESAAMGQGSTRLIRAGFDGELDRLRALETDSGKVLEAYLEEERAASKIQSLKLRYNRLIGYFLECPKSQARLAPEWFIKRQSTASGERYSTERLARLQESMLEAADRAAEMERRIFDSIVESIAEASRSLLIAAAWLARLDAACSLAHVAAIRGYSRPEIVKETGLWIEGGRHPVVEACIRSGDFVANPVTLDPEGAYFTLVTGPNMAGKSTYLRQCALIALMAHAGSFVPASVARIGILDRIFCRVGAQDNLARGESTFLVEMHETAQILRSATERSLVIMDEVGRGTSTTDGLAIAKAVSEHLLLKTRALTLFATHYLELSRMECRGFSNASMAVAEDGDRVVFLKRLTPGAAAGSYGIHVAELAGVPAEVCARARQLKDELENCIPSEEDGANGRSSTSAEDDPRHASGNSPAKAGQDLFDPRDLLVSEILSLDIDRMTPLEALSFLAALQRRASPS